MLLAFNDRFFPGEPGSVGSPSHPSLLPSVLEEKLWGFVAGCPSRHPTNSVKALKETQSTNPNQWPGIILSSATTGRTPGTRNIAGSSVPFTSAL